MSRKKEDDVLPQAEQDQVQRVFERYHEIASSLRNSREQAEVEAGLASFNALSEPAQITFLKGLARERQSAAADIATAIHTFGQAKAVRKEARRVLLGLEGAKVYANWVPPISQSPVSQVQAPPSARFWKGFVTQTREQGEMQLLLFWEQGYDYTEVRNIIFLLEFWQEGVKDVIVETTSKRIANERIDDMRTQLIDIPLVDCTLAEASRLLEEALSVNEWRRTKPAQSYRTNLSLITNTILRTADPGEDRGSTFIHPDLTEHEVVANYLGAWTLGDYGLTYDLLSPQNTIAESLSRSEWIEQHRAWADEAHPTRLDLGFVHTLEAPKSLLWLPGFSRGNQPPTRKEVETGWSVEIQTTPLSGTLKDMPMGSVINQETSRHWFWTTYTLQQQGSSWRIQSLADEGVKLQGVPLAELQKRINDYEKTIESMSQNVHPANPMDHIEELQRRIQQLLFFDDVLISRLPLDHQILETAHTHAVRANLPERAIAYLERMVQRFPDTRAETLRTLGATLVDFAFDLARQQQTQRSEAMMDRAETLLRDVLATENNALNHTLLAELLLARGRFDETEAELTRAKALPIDSEIESNIEAGFGNLNMRRERFKEAIPHFRRVLELNPNYPTIRFNLGFAYRLLGDYEEAEAIYLQAIEANPQDIRPYSELTAIYMNRPDEEKALAIIEQGARTNPDSARLRALMSSVLLQMGRQRQAQRALEEAEMLDPQDEVVLSVRQILEQAEKKR